MTKQVSDHAKDLILFAEGKYIEITMMQNLLENNDIPCFVQSDVGASFVMQAGNLLENYKLYVDKDYFDEAHELIDAEMGN